MKVASALSSLFSTMVSWSFQSKHLARSLLILFYSLKSDSLRGCVLRILSPRNCHPALSAILYPSFVRMEGLICKLFVKIPVLLHLMLKIRWFFWRASFEVPKDVSSQDVLSLRRTCFQCTGKVKFLVRPYHCPLCCPRSNFPKQKKNKLTFWLLYCKLLQS